MDTICFIHLPDDFDERYHKYREMLLEDEPQKTSPKEVEESVIIPQTRFSKNEEATEILVGEKQESNMAVFDVPQGTKWNHIKIEFQNREDVEISISGKFFIKSNAKEMGFIKGSTKDEKINRQWEFLLQLAVIYFAKDKDGKLLMEPTIANLAKGLKMSENAVTKAKEKLETQLSADFGIKDEDPFYEYEHSGYYKTRFELVPELELRRSYTYKFGEQFDDSKSYHKSGQSGADEEENESGDLGDLMK